MIQIQKQVWDNLTRYLIFDTDGGSIQLNLYTEKQDFDSTACIYALYVDKNKRRKGIAKRLLDTAEQIAIEAGHKDIVLDYEYKDTPIEIFDWYRRQGYKPRFAQMKKEKAMTGKEINPIECKFLVNHHCAHPYYKGVSCESWSLCDLFTPKTKRNK